MENQPVQPIVTNTPVETIPTISKKPKRSDLVFVLFVLVVLLLGTTIYFASKNLQVAKKPIPQTQTINTPSAIPTAEFQEDLIFRCGDYPTEVPAGGQFLLVNGPEWSPDCRHISWSFYHYFTGGWMGEDDNVSNTPVDKSVKSDEGLFLYTDSSKLIKRVAFPDNKDQLIKFKQWKDSDTIIYDLEDKTFMYEISLNQTTLVE